MYKTLKYLYPAATDNDFVLQDDCDGNGPRIVQWNTDKLGPQPTDAEIEAARLPSEKEEALSRKISDLEIEYTDTISTDFEYQGNMFAADYLQILWMGFRSLTLNQSEPIPTIDGSWATTTYEADGITRVRVPFTCKQFLDFCAVFYARRTDCFAARLEDEVNVKKIRDDDTKTPDDIKKYKRLRNFR